MLEKETKDIIVTIPSEFEDDYSDDSMFNITSWGADLSFRELVTMYEEDEMLKPELQRNYVWDRNEASRFIESILMGLPVPSIFLAQRGTKKLIVDGYQRIMTVHGYIRGQFPGDAKLFRLTNTERINHRWRGKAFSELTSDEQRKLKSTTIHAIVFEQKKPQNSDTSLFQIFERINTSGRSLMPQEIRNCIYQGSFNKLLITLNNNNIWRKLFGMPQPDVRMRDMEYILRFFLFTSGEVQKSPANQISLKKALNDFMAKYQDIEEAQSKILAKQFEDTIEKIYSTLGDTAFNNHSNGKYIKKFHPTIFDAIATAYFEKSREAIDIKILSAPEKHVALLQNEEFIDAISIRTTNVDKISKRIQLAKEYLLEK